VSITLPPELHTAAQERADEAGFASIDEYVAFLVEQALANPVPSPTPNDERELESLLMEGIESGPAVEMTQKDWDDIRNEIRARRERRKSR